MNYVKMSNNSDREVDYLIDNTGQHFTRGTLVCDIDGFEYTVERITRYKGEIEITLSNAKNKSVVHSLNALTVVAPPQNEIFFNQGFKVGDWFERTADTLTGPTYTLKGYRAQIRDIGYRYIIDISGVKHSYLDIKKIDDPAKIDNSSNTDRHDFKIGDWFERIVDNEFNSEKKIGYRGQIVKVSTNFVIDNKGNHHHYSNIKKIDDPAKVDNSSTPTFYRKGYQEGYSGQNYKSIEKVLIDDPAKDIKKGRSFRFGHYPEGGLTIFNNWRGGVFAKFDTTPITASKAREAAHILNQFAEYLDPTTDKPLTTTEATAMIKAIIKRLE